LEVGKPGGLPTRAPRTAADAKAVADAVQSYVSAGMPLEEAVAAAGGFDLEKAFREAAIKKAEEKKKEEKKQATSPPQRAVGARFGTPEYDQARLKYMLDQKEAPLFGIPSTPLRPIDWANVLKSPR